MAIDTTHFAFQNGMMMGQLKFCPHFQMALKTGAGRAMGIDDRSASAAGLDVEATRSVTRFATDVLCVLSLCHQSPMGRRPEIADDVAVAGVASIRTDELRSGNVGRRENGPVRLERAAGKQAPR